MDPKYKYIIGTDVADPKTKDQSVITLLCYESGVYISEYTAPINTKEQFLQAIEKIKEHYDKIQKN